MERNNIILKKEYLKTLFPIMFSIMGGTVTSIIDTVMVSAKLGSEGLAVINLCMPISLCLCAMGGMISAGASILSAREAGSQNAEGSEGFFFNGIMTGLLFGLVITILGIICCGPIARLLAQDGGLTQSVKEYGFVLFAGAIPFILAYLPLDYLQLEGKGRAITIMMLITIGADIFFDWLFLFAIPLRYYGSAAASVISMFAAAIYGFVVLQKSNSKYRIDIAKCKFLNIKAIILAGSSSASATFCDAIKMMVLNTLILAAGGTKLVAIWAVITVFSELSRTITSGVAQTAAPMIGVFYASNENAGIRLLVRIETKIGLILVSAYALIVLVFHGFIGSVYRIDDSLFFPFICLGLYLYMELLASIWSSIFYATGQVSLANIFSLLKGLALPVVFAFLFTSYGKYIWIFLPISVFSSLIIVAIMTNLKSKHTRRGNHSYSPLLLLDDYFAKIGSLLEFSVEMKDDSICEASERIGDFCEHNKMDQKMVNCLGLAIEEYLMIIKEKGENPESVDLRVTAIDDTTIIRVRSIGKQYNPFWEEKDNMGISLLQKIATDIQFNYTLGMNNIDIIFCQKNK